MRPLRLLRSHLSQGERLEQYTFIGLSYDRTTRDIKKAFAVCESLFILLNCYNYVVLAVCECGDNVTVDSLTVNYYGYCHILVLNV